MELLNLSRTGLNAGVAIREPILMPCLRHLVFDMVDKMLFDSDENGCAAVRQFLELRSSALQNAKYPFRLTLTGNSISAETARRLVDIRWSSLFTVDDNVFGGAS